MERSSLRVISQLGWAPVENLWMLVSMPRAASVKTRLVPPEADEGQRQAGIGHGVGYHGDVQDGGTENDGDNPHGQKPSVGVPALHGHADAGIRHQEIAEQDEHGPVKTEFLSQRRENEVRVGEGKRAVFFRAVSPGPPRPAPSGQGDGSTVLLEAGAQAVGVQVFPGQETFQAVGVALHQNVQGRSGQGESPAQVILRVPATNMTQNAARARATEVPMSFSKKNQGKRNAEDKAGHHKTPPERGGAVPVQGQPVGPGPSSCRVWRIRWAGTACRW